MPNMLCSLPVFVDHHRNRSQTRICDIFLYLIYKIYIYIKQTHTHIFHLVHNLGPSVQFLWRKKNNQQNKIKWNITRSAKSLSKYKLLLTVGGMLPVWVLCHPPAIYVAHIPFARHTPAMVSARCILLCWICCRLLLLVLLFGQLDIVPIAVRG